MRKKFRIGVVLLIWLESLCGKIARRLEDGIGHQEDHQGNGILFGGHMC